ncbi:probable Adenylyltransferase and sulfurtransferase UBA4 [Hanseniaspora guilliermondii]|uniref:Probable Adenylyltransferase and sulfurtransferase UBA4 n=1 Tax=Hanseniaspora guilliermondii TaxID=56406 RepID=A0A1L0FJQ9_9ASCO|nr:probable Adenylyltransferase and sulfurtransferase UBA4 [Hanseniaspora guilliermondii]
MTDTLSNEEFSRYGRQMIVQGISNNRDPIEHQLLLKSSKICVIGAGGLAAPCLSYLAGAGVGEIGIIDDDIVETSNLHRQIIHSTSRQGELKCNSAKKFINDLNPHVKVKTHPVRLTNDNAFEIFEPYDVILDCTDTPMTRYLASDVCVLLGKTLVSASGVNTEGQLTILNFENIGPCYRCFHPKPPPPNTVSSCSMNGVIGACIGLVGIMQAVETLKVLQKVYTKENFEPFMLQYNGYMDQSLRRFRMRKRRSDCVSCGDEREITREKIESYEINYLSFCGSRNYDVVDKTERITPREFQDRYWSSQSKDHVVIDVRPEAHYKISNFHTDKVKNIPLATLTSLKGDINKLKDLVPEINEDSEVVVFCRYGNDSRLATRELKDKFGIKNTMDVIGGFFGYIDQIDPSIPKY